MTNTHYVDSSLDKSLNQR